MNKILISYDLCKPGKDYPTLWKHLETYAWARPLESIWIIKTTLTTAQVRDAATNFVDQNDKIFAVDITSSGWASRNIPDEVATWLKAPL